MREYIFMNNIIKDTMEYDKDIQIIAKWLSHGDSFLAEELRSEMHIAIMNMEPGQDKGIYLRVAKFRAIDYLRSRATNYSYGGIFKHVSLEAMEDAGFQIDTEGHVYAPRNHRTDMDDLDDNNE